MRSKFDMPLGRQLMIEKAAASCIGCAYSRGHGDRSWCANAHIAVQARPEGRSMQGCTRYVASSSFGEPSSAVGVSLARIAARRSTR